jgi:hypothetical protein
MIFALILRLHLKIQPWARKRLGHRSIHQSVFQLSQRARRLIIMDDILLVPRGESRPKYRSEFGIPAYLNICLRTSPVGSPYSTELMIYKRLPRITHYLFFGLHLPWALICKYNCRAARKPSWTLSVTFVVSSLLFFDPVRQYAIGYAAQDDLPSICCSVFSLRRIIDPDDFVVLCGRSLRTACR